MNHLYFVRHGLSKMNEAGLFSGHTDTPLTQKGRLQAQKAGQKAKMSGIVFDAVITSPLKRAHETAVIIARELGFPRDEIITNVLLKERHFGELEGAPYDMPEEAYLKDPFLLDQIPRVETIADLHRRAEDVFLWLDELEYDSILIVAHGAIGRALRRVIEKKSLQDAVQPFKNATIVQLV